ncbi:MAG: MATE family efflux transporter, partial [Lachnospiraceae bacterium]|nr:MATE family efflux transporter [Lachnospiraceae bacterium]
MLATTFFQSINRPAPSIIITVLRQIIFLVPFIYILPILLEINGIFFAQPISDLLATALSVLLVLKEKKRMMCNSVLS